MTSLTTNPSEPNRTLILTWAYARRELVFISWALMEVALITPFSLAILPWTDEWWGAQRLFFGVLLLMLAGFYLARFLTRIQLPARDQRNILVGAGLLLMFLAIRNINYDPAGLFDFSWIGQSLRNLATAGDNLWLRDLFLLMLTALSWWRGLTLLNRDIDVLRVGHRFRVGGLYIAPVIILLASIRLDWSVLPFLLFFFAISLTAVALTRAETTEKSHGAILSSLTPRWLGLVVSLSVITTFLGGAAAVFVSNLSGDSLGRWLAPFWQALRWGGQTIGLTASYLIAPFLDSIEAFIQFFVRVFQNLLAAFFEPNPNAPTAPDNGGNLMEEFNRFLLEREISGEAGLFSNVNWRFVIIGVVLLIALLILVQFYRKNLVAQGNGRFGKILLDVTDRIPFVRSRREKSQSKQSDWRNWRAAVSIIKIYQQMIQIGSEFGYPRDTSETPYEYLKTLFKLWPERKQEVQLITRAYVKVRYGEFPETKEEFETIKAAWERVQQTAVLPAVGE
ncbi:MAG: hypothetical protein CL608_23365 [Anaerolineaceae bacterium]|nr:hypothetical protein [Anaerolineaceae bacterium]